MNVPGLVVGGLLLYTVATRLVYKYVNNIEYDFRKIRFKVLPLGGTLTVDFKNNNTKPVSITAMQGNIIYTGIVVGAFETTQAVTLAVGEKVQANVKFSVSGANVITALLTGYQSGKPPLNLTVKGVISAAGFSNIPFEQIVGYEVIT
jgi:hypothetical protein